MYVENDFNFFSIWFLQKLKIKIAAIDYLYRMSRVPPPHDGSLVADDKPTAVHINRRSKLTVIPPGVPPGVPPPHDGSLVADGGKPAVHINRRSKLTVIPPKDDTDVDERVPPGVPSPHDGPGKPAVHINRRSKLTVIPPKDDSGGVGRGSAGAGASGAGAVSGDVMTYISSLSSLEQHVCRIAESHLESSFDILRSTGYIAWKAKNA
jgi:hypothetical protein